MMERLADWDHDQFKKVIVKVANMEIAYRAVSFYLARQVRHLHRTLQAMLIQHPQPTLLPDLLAALSPRLDHSRVIKILQTEDHLPLAKPYLIATQKLNLAVINEAYNDLLIEEEDHITLRSSLETYDEYDAIKLAKRLEKHELLEFRRIAALLYRVSYPAMGWVTKTLANICSSSTLCGKSLFLYRRLIDYGETLLRLLLRARTLPFVRSLLATLFLLATRMLSLLFSMSASSLSELTLLRKWYVPTQSCFLAITNQG